MADNFLENQMEQYRAGKTVVRQVNQPLDLLLRKLAEQDGGATQNPETADQNSDAADRTTEKDPALKVKQAQLEAALRSARLLFGDTFEATSSEDDQSITLGFGGTASGELRVGVILVIRLKAAELGLGSRVVRAKEPGSVIIRFRPLRSK